MDHGEEVAAASHSTIPLVLRITHPSFESVDWRVDHVITFHDVMEVLAKLVEPSQSSQPTAFEYEDEDGDRITVRTDEELQAMIQWHLYNCQRLSNGVGIFPLQIFPRVSKSSSKRNAMGLTVDLGASSTPSVVQGSGGGSSGRKQPQDLSTILSSGQIYQQDIQSLSLIGHGNGGTVYKAFHIPSQKTMAMKVIPLDITEEIQKQILSELDILFKCNSPYILGFYGAFFIENKISICTELMDGGSLDSYGVIPENVLGRVAVNVVKGLQYLWNLKIIHRDVKPNNMLVNTQGQIKLCDFGVSIQLVNSIAKTYVGTNAYMAPERILGDEYGIHSDVWSFGLSLVEMSTGMFPYPSDRTADREHIPPIELLQCIVNESPPRLSAEVYGDPLRDFVMHCLQKSPKGRPTPEQLSTHPFIQQNDTDNQTSIVSEFVCRTLQTRQNFSP